MHPQDTTPQSKPRKPRRPRVTCTCRECGCTFLEHQCNVDEGRGLFCSKKCYGLSKATPLGRQSLKTGLCSVPGCNKPHSSRGYCDMHYARWRRTGDPNIVRPHVSGPRPERRGIKPAHAGKPLPPAWRANISRAQKGRKISPEQIERHRQTMTGRTETPEHRAKISAALKGKPKSAEAIAKMRGPNSPRWQGGKTKRLLNRKEWRAVRAIVIERAGGRCEQCGVSGVTLCAHHVIPERQGGPDHPDNLQAWCRPCHARHHAAIHRHLLKVPKRSR